MIEKFFGTDIYRVANLSDMFFNIKGMAQILKVHEKTIRRMIEQCNEARVLELPRGQKGQPTHGLRNIYTTKTVLSLLFATHHEFTSAKNTKIREWIATVINQICFDEFVSLHGYRLGEHQRRRIMTYVCGYERHKDIVLGRFDIRADYCNSVMRGSRFSYLSFMQLPDAYIDRLEVMRIKAIDLAVYHLCEYTGQDPDELLTYLGIPISYGEYTEADKKEVLRHLNKYFKDGILKKKRK